MLVIKNGKDTQTLLFGYSCLRALGEQWGFVGVQDIVNKVIQAIAYFVENDANGNVIEKEVSDIPFHVMDMFVDILKASTGKEDFNGLHFGDWAFKNIDQLGLVMNEFVKSLPQEKKQLAPKKE
jgi:hypothetical protein